MSTGDSLYLVFSIPPAEVGAEEFNEWYAHHVDEVLAVPGLASAKRYEIRALDGDEALAAFLYLALYEIEGDVMQAMAALDEAEDSWTPGLPSWAGGIRYSAWKCRAADRRDGAPGADNLVLVFSSPPEGVASAELQQWLEDRARGRPELPGAPWLRRYRLEASASAPWSATHLEVYETEQARDAPDAGSAPGAPEWADRIREQALSASAITARVGSPLS